MNGLNTNTAQNGTQPHNTVDASKQDDVEGTYQLLQTQADLPFDVMNLPSTSPGQGVSVNVSNSVNIKCRPTSSGDLKAEEQQEKSTSYELGTPFLPLGEDILPGKVLVGGNGDTCEEVSRSTQIESNSAGTEENAVVQKLLRRWRYFDSGDKTFHIESHAGNSTAQARRKPCFVCGDVQHTGKKCRKRRTCYTCNERGHIAEDCPKSNQEFNICLKCSESGHDLFSCHKDYPLDDLKNIQCYVCNEVGHICCSGSIDINPTATISCYNCGECGHSGLECSKPHVDKRTSQPPSICYKCGEEGHVARRCIANPGALAKHCVNNAKGNILNPMTPQQGQDASAMMDIEAEPNDPNLRRSRRAVRKSRIYRYGRARKRRMKELEKY